MPSILLLTGPSASGKTTVNRLLAARLSTLHTIDGDHFRFARGGMTVMPSPGYMELVQRGAMPMPNPPLSPNAWCPSVEAIALETLTHLAAGHSVSIAEVLNDSAITAYRQLFASHPLTVVLLLPSRTVLQERFDLRANQGGIKMPLKMLDNLYAQQTALTGCDLILDASDQSPGTTASKLLLFV